VLSTYTLQVAVTACLDTPGHIQQNTTFLQPASSSTLHFVCTITETLYISLSHRMSTSIIDMQTSPASRGLGQRWNKDHFELGSDDWVPSFCVERMVFGLVFLGIRYLLERSGPPGLAPTPQRTTVSTKNPLFQSLGFEKSLLSFNGKLGRVSPLLDNTNRKAKDLDGLLDFGRSPA
jgi:hypothetical protein